MNYIVDEDFLISAGIKIDDQAERQNKINTLNSELEIRVGNRIIKDFTDEQIDEFEVILDKKAEDKSLEWLENNYPDYKKVVAEEFGKLSSEIKSGKL